MTEAIILLCTIFGTIIAYLAYKSSTTDALKESRTLLSEKFEFLKRLNSDLIKDLRDYGQAQGSYDFIFMQGLTLKQCIDLLSKVQTEILSGVNYTAIQKANSKLRVDELIKNMDIQIKHHSEVRTAFDYYIKPEL